MSQPSEPVCRTSSATTRRRFLSTAGRAGVAATLPAFLPRLYAADAAADERLGIALVGLGRLSTHQLAPALQSTKHAKLSAIVTGTPAKAKAWREQYGLPASHVYDYETFDRIADNDDVDIVYIVLPNGMHHEYVLRAAAAGKHVLCEKPMANTAAECREMIAACDKAGRQLAVGYRCQFEPHHQECMRIAQKELLGKVRQVDAGFTMRIEDFAPDDPKHWRLEKELAGGGALMDIGIYALNACRYLTGEEPASVAAQEIKTNPEKFAEVDETIVWTMTFPGGVTATCSTSYDYHGVNRFTVYADRGQFGLDPAYSYGGNRGFVNDRVLQRPEVDQFGAEMDDFAECVRAGRPSRVPGQEGLKDLLAIEAIYESIRSGQTTKVSAVDAAAAPAGDSGGEIGQRPQPAPSR